MSELQGAPSINKLRARLAADATNEPLRLQVAQTLLQSGDAKAAREVGLVLVQSSADALWEQAHVLLGQAAEQLGLHDEARACWETLLALDVDHVTARAQLARLSKHSPPSTPPRTTSYKAEATLLSPEGVVAARYEIIAELGRGATGTVFLARDTHLGLQVALKVLHPFLGVAARSEMRERFFREARLAAALRHPGVVAVYDLDEHTRSLSLEYLPLGTLRERMNAAGRLDAGELRATVERLLLTLAHVHGSGLIHGDIKPRNILLRAPGDPVLGDFGVARLCDSNDNASGGGTPLYFAPEQLRGAGSNIATDVFAVGALVWELVVGRAMRSHADLTSGRFEAPTLPDGAVADLGATGAALARFVASTTATAPAARPASAQAALALL